MWFRFISILLFSFSSMLNASGQNFLGDTLSEGQHYASSTVSASDWHMGADYINDASISSLDELDRGFLDANTKGYNFQTFLTYKYGLTQDLSLGVKYGYTYQKEEMNIDTSEAGGSQGNNLKGDWVTEGGSDLTILGAYRLDETSSVDVFVDLPICESEDLSALCQNKLSTLDNANQNGSAGGQGKGFYRVGGAVSSNWITEMDTHWMGSVFGSAAVSEKINGEKVTAPITYGASFGAIMPIKQNHMWTGMLTLTRMLKYSSYSTQAQGKVNYSAHSSLAFKGEYLWDFMPRVQLKPFAELAMIQLPSQAFTYAGVRRSIEFTSGTNVTIGAVISTTF